MPNPSIELAADAPAATILVRYIDASGELQGPFPIKFDPEAAIPYGAMIYQKLPPATQLMSVELTYATAACPRSRRSAPPIAATIN